jgi:hypothetical protein
MGIKEIIVKIDDNFQNIQPPLAAIMQARKTKLNPIICIAKDDPISMANQIIDGSGKNAEFMSISQRPQIKLQDLFILTLHLQPTVLREMENML